MIHEETVVLTEPFDAALKHVKEAFAAEGFGTLTEIGMLLPCNVVVRELNSEVIVEVMDPGLMATITGTDEMKPIADEARQLVNNTLARLKVTN